MTPANRLVGTWRDSESGDIWIFSKIEEPETTGQLLISHNTNPPTGTQREYQNVWGSDGSILIRVITNNGFYSEHLVTFINDNNISIQYPTKDSLVALNKA